LQVLHAESPRSRIIELTADGRDYRVRDEPKGHIDWKLLSLILRAAERKLSRREILAAWPAEPKPDDVTVYRWLERPSRKESRSAMATDAGGAHFATACLWWKKNSSLQRGSRDVERPPPSLPRWSG
jgi:hypothetical protein